MRSCGLDDGSAGGEDAVLCVDDATLGAEHLLSWNEARGGDGSSVSSCDAAAVAFSKLAQNEVGGPSIICSKRSVVFFVGNGDCPRAADAVNAIAEDYRYNGRCPSQPFASAVDCPTSFGSIAPLRAVPAPRDAGSSAGHACEAHARELNDVLQLCSSSSAAVPEIECGSFIGEDNLLVVAQIEECRRTAEVLTGALARFAAVTGATPATVACSQSLLLVTGGGCSAAADQINIMIDGAVNRGGFPSCETTTTTTTVSSTTTSVTTTSTTTTLTSTPTTTPTTTLFEAGVVCVDVDFSDGEVGTMLAAPPSSLSTCEAHARVVNAAVELCDPTLEDVVCRTEAGVDHALAVDGTAAECNAVAAALNRLEAARLAALAPPTQDPGGTIVCFGNVLVVPGPSSDCESAAVGMNSLLANFNSNLVEVSCL